MTDKGDNPRDAIVEAAIGLLADHGYGGMRIQQVADAVGLRKGSLFHHFKGKAELTAAAVRSVQHRFLEIIEPLSEETPSWEEFERMLDRLIQFTIDEPATAHLALRTFIDPIWPPEVFRSPESLEQRIFDLLCSWIARAARVGVIRELEPRPAVFQLMGMVLIFPASLRAERNSPAAELPAQDRWTRHLRQMIRDALAPTAQRLVRG